LNPASLPARVARGGGELGEEATLAMATALVRAGDALAGGALKAGEARTRGFCAVAKAAPRALCIYTRGWVVRKCDVVTKVAAPRSAGLSPGGARGARAGRAVIAHESREALTLALLATRALPTAGIGAGAANARGLGDVECGRKGHKARSKKGKVRGISTHLTRGGVKLLVGEQGEGPIALGGVRGGDLGGCVQGAVEAIDGVTHENTHTHGG